MRPLLLLGYFGAGNFGDDALLADWLLRHADWLRERELRCTVLSGGAPPLQSFSLPGYVLQLAGTTVGRMELLRQPRGTYGAVVVPGGSVLQDATSLRSLLYYLAVLWWHGGGGGGTYLLSQGLGPFRSPVGASLCAKVLSRAQFLSVRDSLSYDWSRAHLGPQAPQPLLSADPIVASTVLSGTSKAGVDYDDYAVLIPRASTRVTPGAHERLATVVRMLNVATGLQVRLLPLHPEHDLALCRQAAKAAPEISMVCEVTRAQHAGVATAIEIAGSALVVSYRLHGVIAAVAASRLAFGIAYDPKVSSFCDEADVWWAASDDAGTDSLAIRFKQLWAARGERIAAQESSRALLALRLVAADEAFREAWDRAG